MGLQTMASLVVLAGLATGARPVVAQDWSQWRGPERDGAVTSFSEPKSWPERLTERWKVEVGLGYATPLVVGERIYMYAPQDDAWTTENVWHTDEVSLHMSNGVAVDGVLLGLSHLNSGQYFGLDLVRYCHRRSEGDRGSGNLPKGDIA